MAFQNHVGPAVGAEEVDELLHLEGLAVKPCLQVAPSALREPLRKGCAVNPTQLFKVCACTGRPWGSREVHLAGQRHCVAEAWQESWRGSCSGAGDRRAREALRLGSPKSCQSQGTSLGLLAGDPCGKSRRGFVRPLAQTCFACQCPVTKNPRHHASRCAVVFQVAAARGLLRFHPAPSVEEVRRNMDTETTPPDTATQLAEMWGEQFLTTSALTAPAASDPGPTRTWTARTRSQEEGHGHFGGAPAAGRTSQSVGGVRAGQDDGQAGSGPRGLFVHAEGRQRIHSTFFPCQSHTGTDGTVGKVANTGVVAPLCDAVQVRGSGAPQEAQASPGGQGHAALRDPPGRHLKFHMLRWDSSTQTMVVDDHRPTMNCTDTESRLQTLVAEAAESTNVIRFHATRPMQNSQTKIIVILELSSRAAVLHRALLDLCGHPIWSLVSASLKQCGALRWHRLWRKSWRASSEDSDGARGCLAPRQRRPLAGRRGTAFPALGT